MTVELYIDPGPTAANAQWRLEPPNKGHYGTNNLFIPCREVIPMLEVLISMEFKQVSLCREVIPMSKGPLSEVPLESIYWRGCASL